MARFGSIDIRVVERLAVAVDGFYRYGVPHGSPAYEITQVLDVGALSSAVVPGFYVHGFIGIPYVAIVKCRTLMIVMCNAITLYRQVGLHPEVVHRGFV